MSESSERNRSADLSANTASKARSNVPPSVEPKVADQTDRPPRATYSRKQRLCHKREFQAVFALRQAAGGSCLVVFGLPNGLPFNRLGISVGRKYGGAVQRNRFKRWCREAFRLTRSSQPTGWDWVITPQKPKDHLPTPTTTFAVLERDFLTQIRRLARRLESASPVDSTNKSSFPQPPASSKATPKKNKRDRKS